MNRFVLAGFLAGTALVQPQLAAAQQAPGAAPATEEIQPGEIVVTAQKRSETAQRVPISLSAFNKESLEVAGVANPGDLQRITPTFKFTSSIGTLAARLSIRGVGTFSNSAIEPSVATFIDGVYVPRPASIINSMLDVASIEVLSGPQGTLFGRNASVGAVSIHSAEPTDNLSGTFKSEYSTGNRFRNEGAVNLPVSDKVKVRVAGLVDKFDGYWHNDLTGGRFGGLDTYQGRITVKSELADSLTWTVRGEYQKNKGDGVLNSELVPATLSAATLARLTTIQGGIVPQQNLYSDHNNIYTGHAYINDRIWGLNSDLSYHTGGDFTLRLIDAYYDWDSHQGDGDTASLAIYVLGRDLRYNSKSHSHELQIISPKGMLDGKLDFVGGLYYFHEDLGIAADSLNGTSFCSTLIPIGATGALGPNPLGGINLATCNSYTGPSSTGDFRQSTRSLAAYGQMTYELLPNVRFTGGIRYTDEKKNGQYTGTVFNPTGTLVAANESTALTLSENKVTYRLNLAWNPSRDVMLFGTVSTGFKSGGFNNGVATAVLGQDRIFKAETTTNYEFGIKSQFLDRKVTLNATVYRMDIGNFQERSIVNTTSSIHNVGSVRNQGVEFQLTVAPNRFFKVNSSIAYLDSKILSYCNAPRPAGLPGIPANPTSANCPTLATGTQDLSGVRLNYAPAWTGTVGAEIGGEFGNAFRWTLNGDVNFVSSQLMGTVIDNNPLTRQGDYALGNLRVTLYGPNDKWSISAFGRNITNTGYCASKVIQVLDGPLGMRFDGNGDGLRETTAVRCNVGAPSVLGVSGKVNF